MVRKFFTLSSIHFIFICSFYFTFILNNCLWDFVEERVDIGSLIAVWFVFSLAILVFALYFILFCLIIWPKIGKILLIILLMGSAAADFVMCLPKADSAQALLYILVMAGLPAIGVLFTNITALPSKQEISQRLSYLSYALMVAIVAAVATYSGYILV